MPATLCPLCNKRLATVTITEVDHTGSVRSLPCCHHCKERLDIRLGNHPTPIAEILERNQRSDSEQADLSEASQAFAHLDNDPDDGTGERRCPDCGITWSRFIKRNRFGCARDVEIFADLLEEPLNDVHGTVEHRGRHSGASSDQGTAAARRSLQQELQRAIADEAYERAAELRDALRELDEGQP